MALALAEVPHRTGGVQAAMAYLTQAARGELAAAA
jgi:alanine-glyoxylate transaminase/serine-glyoxylate transaminase/serine-pyruvate transaminase